MHALIVHGGAGKFLDAHKDLALDGCRDALEETRAILRDGASALDAVEHAVKLLENNPVFDAGTGSFQNTEGQVEMDAIIVDGASLRFGAVAAIQHVANPVAVARAVMERTPHAMLAGTGATRFAHANGFPHVPTEQLIGHGAGGPQHGTVGAVALDEHGHVAAATSTGGTANKLPGRVGDSPLIGCGAIADDAFGGVSATGTGENLMRIMMARAVLDFIARDYAPEDAAKRAVQLLAQRTQGTGGVIVLDRTGLTGAAFNTTHLARASVTAGGRVTVAL